MSKTILITGASSGIGKALSFEMARKGYRLGLMARNTAALESIREELSELPGSSQVVVAGLDVTDYTAVFDVIQDLARRLNGFDTIFINAGIGLGEKIGRGDFEKARKTIEVNLIGAIADRKSVV